ncbi:hypothetical protein, partial [Pseudoalteromonas sp.]|uniref:hypothetical protein n=1 Tax=Pseudoalteromonas sp. TaxID=53249 RepID=UPI00262F7700
SSSNCKNPTVKVQIEAPKSAFCPGLYQKFYSFYFALAVLGSTGDKCEHLPVVATAKNLP